jgi:hypothetical protein
MPSGGVHPIKAVRGADARVGRYQMKNASDAVE